MNTKTIKSLLLLTLTVVTTGFWSCETTEQIDDFPLVRPQLVLNAMLNPDSTWEFQVSRSLSVLDNAETNFLQNATIKIYKDDNLLTTITGVNSKSFYTWNGELPQVGHKYKAEVTCNKYTTITAETTVPQKVIITDTKLTIVDSLTTNDDLWSYGYLDGKLQVKFDDNGNEANYYMLSLSSLDTLKHYSFPDSTLLDVDIYKNYYVSDDTKNPAIEKIGSTAYYFTDEYFNGSPFSIDLIIEDYNFRKSKEYVITLYSLNREAYLYLLSLERFNESQGNPFAEPVQVFTNITNGYGILGGVNISKKIIKI